MRKIACVVLCCLSILVLVPNANATLTDTEWLIKAYHDVLFRAPSSQEITYWTAVMGAGSTRYDVAYALFASLEGRVDILGGNPGTVAGMYQAVLGRAPSNSEVQAFLLQFDLSVPVPDSQILADLISTAEFAYYAQQQNPGVCNSNEALVNQIYRVLLNRDADPAGLAFWSGQLSSGMTVRNVAMTIGTSSEYFQNVIQRGYQRFLRRPADTAGITFWLSVLSTSHAIEQFYAQLMASAEYAASGTPETFTSRVSSLPSAEFVSAADKNITTPPPLVPLSAPLAPEVAANSGNILDIFQHLVTQDASISQIGSCSVTTAGNGANAGTVIQDLTAQVGNLQTQVASDQITLSAQNETVAGQQTTIQSLLIGLLDREHIDATAAGALKTFTHQQLQLASQSATGVAAMRLLRHATEEATSGDAALAQGWYARAASEYQEAFRSAMLAIRLGAK